MTAESLPTYSVSELNGAIGNLLERGFAPRFLVNASVAKAQLKKGHLWLTLTDSESSITGVIWSSKLKTLNFRPNESDGVLVIGKLNFWKARASLAIQVLDIRPSLSTVLRKFEVVRTLLMEEGLIDEARRRPLPTCPNCIAILTSSPSSALADILRTGKERWPLTQLIVVPIPVQGDVANKIRFALQKILKYQTKFSFEAIVLARGGGNREDLMVFDDEELCREVANYPLPVVTGLGHEDDLTVADLVSDYRAATPTAAIAALLPSKESAFFECLQRKKRLNDNFILLIRNRRQALLNYQALLKNQSPLKVISRYSNRLQDKNKLLFALSPYRWLDRGFAIVRNKLGIIIRSIDQVKLSEEVSIELVDGEIESIANNINSKALD